MIRSIMAVAALVLCGCVSKEIEDASAAGLEADAMAAENYDAVIDGTTTEMIRLANALAFEETRARLRAETRPMSRDEALAEIATFERARATREAAYQEIAARLRAKNAARVALELHKPVHELLRRMREDQEALRGIYQDVTGSKP